MPDNVWGLRFFVGECFIAAMLNPSLKAVLRKSLVGF